MAIIIVLLLLGGGIFGIWWYLKKRKARNVQPAQTAAPGDAFEERFWELYAQAEASRAKPLMMSDLDTVAALVAEKIGRASAEVPSGDDHTAAVVPPKTAEVASVAVAPPVSVVAAVFPGFDCPACGLHYKSAAALSAHVMNMNKREPGGKHQGV